LEHLNPMRAVPFNELDQLITTFDEAYKVSHDEAYKLFASTRLEPPQDLPADPFSPEYRAAFLELYKRLSNKTEYHVSNEACDFDIDERVVRPFPYYTKSLNLASVHYTLMGKLFEVLDVPPGADILECGFGWGNTTLALSMLGFNVTAIDIEGRFCELVRRRADAAQAPVTIINDDFLWVERTDQTFDAVIFFECFHHCWEFERLLIALHKVLKPGGKIYFAAEPINNDFTVPWGVRLDGESLFVARKAGWMELGFRSDFFDELLSRTGWLGTCLFPHFWVAQEKAEALVFHAADPRLSSQCGSRSGDTFEISNEGSSDAYGLFGPYVTLPTGKFRLDLDLLATAEFAGNVTFDICCNGGQVLYSDQLAYAKLQDGKVQVDFAVEKRAEDLEVRLLVPGGFRGRFHQLSLLSLA
jgi:2-polyprenyl-3-methyl-5-hydroxy-6-metoxy-1,4-benzoquinol methylase